jgi:hypothetical protein
LAVLAIWGDFSEHSIFPPGRRERCHRACTKSNEL